MRILYYCPEYSSQQHGGRTHAREFYAALKKVPAVTQADVWPLENTDAVSVAGGTYKSTSAMQGIRRLFSCFKPRYKLTQDLSSTLERGKYDSVIIRTASHRNLVLSRIKKALPSVTICLEVNALRFEEEYQNIWFRSVLQKLEVMRFENADKIFVVSSNLKEYLVSRGIPSEKIMVNPNGVNERIFDAQMYSHSKRATREYLGIPSDAFVLGYVGGMERFRRLPEVVNRVSSMLRRGVGENIYMLVIGDGEDMPNLKAAVRNNADVLDSRIKIMGWVEYEQVPKIMSTFDLGIFPFTQSYCSPLKMFEYMSLGIATLGPKVPAVEELFENNEHLIFIDKSGANFEEVIAELMRCSKKRIEMAEKGRACVLSRYTWGLNARRAVDFIRGSTKKEKAVAGAIHANSVQESQ